LERGISVKIAPFFICIRFGYIQTKAYICLGDIANLNILLIYFVFRLEPPLIRGLF